MKESQNKRIGVQKASRLLVTMTIITKDSDGNNGNTEQSLLLSIAPSPILSLGQKLSELSLCHLNTESVVLFHCIKNSLAAYRGLWTTTAVARES